jgi:hypothetical protein
MTNPTWPIGPARTRDGREARIYATDGEGDFPIHGATLNSGGWCADCWMIDGRVLGRSVTSPGDLLPPKLTRDQAIAECCNAAKRIDGAFFWEKTEAAITHWEKLKAEGRIDE